MSTLLPILPAEDGLDKTSKLSPAAQQAEEEKNRMRRYFEHPEAQLGPTAHHEPICLYLETTNRCNLLCTTCPRTYEQLEPEADMSWELFTSLIDQYPNIARVVLHGVGEPMLVKDLAQRVAYLKARNIYVLFNTNGTLLTKTNGRALIEAGLDELRVSLDAAEASVFQMVRGKDFFDKIVANVKTFTTMQRELNAPKPRVSLWLTGLRETVDQLPNFVRLAHSIGVTEVYLQRLAFFEDPVSESSLARAESALFEHTTEREEALIHEAESIAKELGVMFSASGAVDPGESIQHAAHRQSVVALSPPLVADVHHRQRPRSALLHRTLQHEGLQQLHPWRRHTKQPPRNMERLRIPALPRRPAHQLSASFLRQLRPPLELVGSGQFCACGRCVLVMGDGLLPSSLLTSNTVIGNS